MGLKAIECLYIQELIYLQMAEHSASPILSPSAFTGKEVDLNKLA